MKFWHDEEKISRYGCMPYTVETDPARCELYAQGRDIERNRRLKATRMFEQDLACCRDDLDAIIALAHGVCFKVWLAAIKTKRCQT